MFEHLPLHLEARNGRIKEMAFFEGEAKYSEQVQIGAINCAPPFTDQRKDLNTCRNGIDRNSTCVVDHNEELSKDSVTDYVTKTDEKSVPISCERARAEAVHAPRDREPSRINSSQENVELVSERQGN